MKTKGLTEAARDFWGRSLTATEAFGVYEAASPEDVYGRAREATRAAGVPDAKAEAWLADVELSLRKAQAAAREAYQAADGLAQATAQLDVLLRNQGSEGIF